MTCISHMTLQRFSCFSYTTISTLVWYLKKSLIKSELSSLDKRFQNVIRFEFNFSCFNEKVNRLFKSKLFECINNSLQSFLYILCWSELSFIEFHSRSVFFWLLFWSASMYHIVASKVQRADLKCDVIKKVAPFVLSKLWILIADWSMRWSRDTFLLKLRLY